MPPENLENNHPEEMGIFSEPNAEPLPVRKRGRGWIIVLSIFSAIMAAAAIFSIVRFWQVTYSRAFRDLRATVYLLVDGSYMLAVIAAFILFVAGRAMGWRLLMFGFIYIITGKLRRMMEVLLDAPDILTTMAIVTTVVILIFPPILLLRTVRDWFGISLRSAAITSFVSVAISVLVQILILQVRRQGV